MDGCRLKHTCKEIIPESFDLHIFIADQPEIWMVIDHMNILRINSITKPTAQATVEVTDQTFI